jgi:DMSO reductase family type II enzyme heme b subunit
MYRLIPVATSLLIAASACGRGPVVDTQQVSARLVHVALPTEDPDARLWRDVPEHPAQLMVQDVTEPRLVEPGVELLRVRAVHDGKWVVFRLEWDDGTEDLIPESGRGSDAAAIQFPLRPGADVPDPAMGQAGMGVRIWYWKAVWQDDETRAREGGGDRIQTLYPHATSDHYPYEANPDARAEMETRYAPARAAGNPITVRPHAGAVQVLTAEGFGDTTVTFEQQGTGKGRWKDGRWAATIARPIDGGPDLAPLEPGSRGYVAFAVWDGAAHHTGSRKMRSGWIPLILEVP